LKRLGKRRRTRRGLKPEGDFLLFLNTDFKPSFKQIDVRLPPINSPLVREQTANHGGFVIFLPSRPLRRPNFRRLGSQELA
ncbi:hypothetical protein SRHO_G00304240, partial [Serrasalmus rhombeus]